MRFSTNLLILCSTFLLTIYIWSLRTPSRDMLPGKYAVNPRVKSAASKVREQPPARAASIVPALLTVPEPVLAEDSFFLHARRYLSLNSKEQRLEKLVPFLMNLSSPNPIHVVKVGANTGYELKYKKHSKHDSIVAAVLNEYARGVLVEPVPTNFAILTTNVEPYSERFKCIPTQTRMDFYTMNARPVQKEWPDAPGWFLNQLGSFDINHLKKHFRVVIEYWTPQHPQNYYIERTVVDALPPRAILEKLYEEFPEARKENGGDGISLLHVDAEGYNWKIMYAFLKTTLPKAIVFEHKHLHPAELKSAISFLKNSGYAHWHHGPNTYAIHLGTSASKFFGN